MFLNDKKKSKFKRSTSQLQNPCSSTSHNATELGELPEWALYINWVELKLHTPWPNFVSLMTPLMFSLCASSVTAPTNVADALLASGHRWLTITALIVFPTLFVQYLPPRPRLFSPSFSAAFGPLNQGTVRFREEVNILVLWLGPFWQCGLYNWKALVDYFKPVVGTDSHVWATAGNGAPSSSVAPTDC